MILHRRLQLIKWLEENAPTASIRRAVGEGSIEFLGWFSTIPGSKYPGWIVRVESSITNLVWQVVVRIKLVLPHSYYAWVLTENILWQYWNPKNSCNPFLQGDNPKIYKQNRENTINEKT